MYLRNFECGLSSNEEAPDGVAADDEPPAVGGCGLAADDDLDEAEAADDADAVLLLALFCPLLDDEEELDLGATTAPSFTKCILDRW